METVHSSQRANASSGYVEDSVSTDSDDFFVECQLLADMAHNRTNHSLGFPGNMSQLNVTVCFDEGEEDGLVKLGFMNGSYPD